MIKDIYSNFFTQLALGLGAIGGLMADQLGKGYSIVLVLTCFIIIYAIFDEYKKKKLYMKQNIPIPIVFNISNPADSRSSLNAIFRLLEKEYPNHKENLEKYYNIIESDLIFKYDGDIFNEKRFIDFLKITKHDIKKLEAQTPHNIDLHIVYIGPIANAILVGTMLGTEGVSLYQYNKSTDNYTISIRIDSREYKESVDEFKIIKKEQIGDLVGDSVTVAIDLASHKVTLCKSDEPIVHLKSIIGETIHNEKDFIRANREIYTVINTLQQKCSHIKLIYSMPTTIAFMLGMSMQNYWDVEITHFDKGEYKTVVKHLDDISYYF